MTGREVLIALWIKNKGSWDDIYKDISDKTDISDKLEAETKDWIASHSALTLLDEEMPGVLKTISKPPFILEYAGDISALTEALEDKNLIAIDDPKHKDRLLDHGLSVIYADTSTDSVLVVASGKSKMSCILSEGIKADDCGYRREQIAGQIANKVLITVQKENGRSAALARYGISSSVDCKMFAVPGNSGSYTNKLIKNGFNLCDTVTDLIDKEKEE